MTKKELVERLSEFDDDNEILVDCSYCGIVVVDDVEGYDGEIHLNTF